MIEIGVCKYCWDLLDEFFFLKKNDDVCLCCIGFEIFLWFVFCYIFIWGFKEYVLDVCKIMVMMLKGVLFICK